jgi:FkbM family methyltransferase
MDFSIVYYIFINPNRDWKKIVQGQINDLLFEKMKPKNMYVCICCKNENLVDECIKIIPESFNPIISLCKENNFEYPGIYKLWEIRKNCDIILYMHTKGMVYNNNSNNRSLSEKITLRNTIYNHRETLKLFNEKGVDKVGLWPNVDGSIFVNFFWIRGKAIPENEPVKTKYRYYYENYILNHTDGYLKSWSLVLNKIGYCDFNRCDIKNKKLQIINYFFENMNFFYGTQTNKINVTDLVFEKCLHNSVISIPSGDIDRSMIFGDPVPGVLKSFFINNTEFKHFSNVYIQDNQIYQVDELPKDIPKLPKSKLNDIHSSLKFQGGSLLDEYPEQVMAVKYIQPDAKVLEIGANIGRNTLVIASMLNDSSNLTTLECDPESYSLLLKNINLNNFQVKAINAALSKKQLVQKNWETYPSEIVPEGFKIVNTLHFEDLKQTFDTLVLDCEGSFFYIIQEFPEIINEVKTIIMENDYWEFSQKEYIDSFLFQNGFWIDYSEPGGWGPCQNFFYQVFKRS